MEREAGRLLALAPSRRSESNCSQSISVVAERLAAAGEELLGVVDDAQDERSRPERLEE